MENSINKVFLVGSIVEGPFFNNDLKENIIKLRTTSNETFDHTIIIGDLKIEKGRVFIDGFLKYEPVKNPECTNPLALIVATSIVSLEED